MTERHTEHFWSPPPGEEIKGIISFRDVVIIACTNGIYVMGDVLAVSGVCSRSRIKKLDLREVKP